MGRYVKAYTGTLALVCTGSIAVAVQAHEKTANLAALSAQADRWERWAKNEHVRDERSYARFNAVASQYRQLARQVERSQRRIVREIAATRSLRRTVVTGAPVVTYRNVRRVIPVVTAPAPASSTATPAKVTGSRPTTPKKTKPLLTATPPSKPGSVKSPAGAGSIAAGSAPATGAPAAPGSAPATPTPVTTAPAGTTPPATAAAPVNTALPSILGQPQSGKTFSADPGTWTGNPTSFSYQWQRCDATGANCVAVGSAQSYTCVPADIDKTMRVAVQATNAAGSAVAVSAASPKTKPS
jgi:hypothetical protein